MPTGHTDQDIVDDLNDMRLPELQQLFHKLTGESTRSPNKRYLFRVIRDARARLQPEQSSETSHTSEPEAAPRPQQDMQRALRRAAARASRQAEPLHTQGAYASQPTAVTVTTSEHDNALQSLQTDSQHSVPGGSLPEPVVSKPLRKCSVEELRALYDQTLGRPTRSKDKDYLMWKIRQAQKGNVPIGPARLRVGGEKKRTKVVPLRIETSVLVELDAAIERMDMKSRMVFFRKAVAAYLLRAGESNVASLFQDPTVDEAETPARTPRQVDLELEGSSR